MTSSWWWFSDSPPKAPRRSSRRCLLSIAAGGVGRKRQQARAAADRALVGVERHLAGALAAPELVDAGVLGDLVDPRLERRSSCSLARRRRSADMNTSWAMSSARPWSCTRPRMNARDPLAVARVQLLERAVVAAACGVDQLAARCRRELRGHAERQCHTDHTASGEPLPTGDARVNSSVYWTTVQPLTSLYPPDERQRYVRQTITQGRSSMRSIGVAPVRPQGILGAHPVNGKGGVDQWPIT